MGDGLLGAWVDGTGSAGAGAGYFVAGETAGAYEGGGGIAGIEYAGCKVGAGWAYLAVGGA